MGSDQSILTDCQIDEAPILKNGSEFSIHHAQRIDEKTQLSVFISKDNKTTLLEMLRKNLKLYRHPFILRFVDSCETNDATYLFTEKVSPLQIVLRQQSPLQVCLGLENIIQALLFLHEEGLACHNNVAQSAIFVTPEGQWKLGGMEFVSKFDSVSQAFLESTHSHRYEKGISPEERSSVAFKDHRKRDIFALGVLIDEVLTSMLVENKSGDHSTYEDALIFLEYSKKSLQSEVTDIRPSLKDILSHPYFKQDFLAIVKFLTDLPLKSDSQRRDFFIGLTEKLFILPEKLVSGQMSPLLLSRLVLLDPTAAKVFIPNLLTPAKGTRSPYSVENRINPILSERHFQDDIIPILLKILLVRDIQIRSVLLRHFSEFCHLFHQILLEEEVLPQLLLGIRDCNDGLVADSLRALADLVPLLGASKVIGKNRRKIFTDGQPGKVATGSSENDGSMKSDKHRIDIVGSIKSEKRRIEIDQKREERKSILEQKKKERDLPVTPERSQTPEIARTLSERHSPIGAESEEEEITDKKSSDIDAWDSWDVEAEEATSSNHIPKSPEVENPRKSSLPNVPQRKTTLDFDDISRLDIKTSGLLSKKFADPFVEDFFADMTPVISSTLKFEAAPALDSEDHQTSDMGTDVKSKFAVMCNNDGEEDGWGGDDGWE